MSDMENRISLYISAEQKSLIEQMADKFDVSQSQYCLTAVEQRIARDLQAQHVEKTDLELQIEDLQDGVETQLANLVSPSTEEEALYGSALWTLLGETYSKDEQTAAMSTASERLEDGLDTLRQQREREENQGETQ